MRDDLLRRYPLTASYALVLSAATIVATASPETNERLYRYCSTNLDNLADHPIVALATSGMMIDGPLVPNLIMALGPMAFAERKIGTGKTLAVFSAGHVGASLITAQTIRFGLARGYYPASVRSDRDVGVSYGSLALRFALIGAVGPGKPRAVAAGSAASWLAITQPWRLPRDFTSTGHTVAAGLGLVMAAALVIGKRRRARRLAAQASRGRLTDRQFVG